MNRAKQSGRVVVCVASVVCVGAMGGAAFGQIATGFEAPDYAGSAGGTALTMGIGGGGQDGWYVPDIAGSIDASVYAYGGNALNIVANAEGGGQFLACVSQGGTAFPRAQRAVTFVDGEVYTATWDTLGAFQGTLPAVDNIGSFSLQPSTLANYYQQLMRWGPGAATGETYEIAYGVFPATGTTGAGAGIVFALAGVAWQNIPVGHWIRQSTTWSFGSNRILSVSIRDLTAGGPETTVDVSTMDWYLAGGAANVLQLPIATDVRCFGGGATIGNISAWDNVRITSVPRCHGSCVADFDDGSGSGVPDGGVTIDDLLYYLGLFGDGASCADVDNGTFTGTQDGGVTIDDLLYFLARFADGC